MVLDTECPDASEFTFCHWWWTGPCVLCNSSIIVEGVYGLDYVSDKTIFVTTEGSVRLISSLCRTIRWTGVDWKGYRGGRRGRRDG